jgi:hypothetical protein
MVALAWRYDFVVVFGVMQDHGVVPHNAVQCNHGVVPHSAIQKGLDCEIFTDLIYYTLKVPKRVNCSHFHAIGHPTGPGKASFCTSFFSFSIIF